MFPAGVASVMSVHADLQCRAQKPLSDGLTRDASVRDQVFRQRSGMPGKRVLALLSRQCMRENHVYKEFCRCRAGGNACHAHTIPLLRLVNCVEPAFSNV